MIPMAREWNTAALGPDKRRLSIDLYQRLKAEYAPKGLAHFGQGKWYPGEPLPRWSLNCFWRRDGEPIWQDPALLSDESRFGCDSTTPRSAFCGRLPPGSGCHPRLCLQPTKMLSTTCGKNGSCPPTWIRLSPGSRMPASASG